MQETFTKYSTVPTRFDPWLRKAQADAVLMYALDEAFPEFDLNYLKKDGRFDEKGLNSIDIATLVCTIEDYFCFKVSNEEYQQFYTIEGARRIITQKLQSSAHLAGATLQMTDVQSGWKTLVHHMISRLHSQRGAKLSR